MYPRQSHSKIETPDTYQREMSKKQPSYPFVLHLMVLVNGGDSCLPATTKIIQKLSRRFACPIKKPCYHHAGTTLSPRCPPITPCSADSKGAKTAFLLNRSLRKSDDINPLQHLKKQTEWYAVLCHENHNSHERTERCAVKELSPDRRCVGGGG